jgi:hypothetical protein
MRTILCMSLENFFSKTIDFTSTKQGEEFE